MKPIFNKNINGKTYRANFLNLIGIGKSEIKEILYLNLWLIDLL